MERSYNGWTASPSAKDFGGLDNRAVGGVKMVPGVRKGDVATVLFYVAEQFHARVENLVSPGCWGHAYRKNRNAANLSCHSSATAIDLNAPRHPNGKRGTFTKGQVAEIRKILAAVGGIVRWGGDFTGTPDEMHFEIVASPATVAMVAARLAGSSSVGSPVSTLPAAPSAPVQEDPLSALSDDAQRKLAAEVTSAAKDAADARWYATEIKAQTDLLLDEDRQTDLMEWGLFDPEQGLRVQVASLQGQLAGLVSAVQQLGVGGGALDMGAVVAAADRAASKAATEALGGVAEALAARANKV